MTGPGCADVRVHGVGGEVIDVAVSTRSHHHSVGSIALNSTCLEIAGYDAARHSVVHHQIHHLVASVQFHCSTAYLSRESAVGAQQQLLPRLAASIEGAAYLCSSERTVVEKSAVVPRKWHPLCYTLVYDVATHFGKTIHIGFPCSIVSSFYGVFEQTFHTVAVILVVLGGVDTALSRYAVSPTGGILQTENIDIEAERAKSGCCRTSGKSGTYHYDIQLAFVGRIYQTLTVFISCPFLGERTFGYLGV